MTPIERLKADLERSQQGARCQVDDTVKQAQEEYERQADEADQRLREKQAQALKRFLG